MIWPVASRLPFAIEGIGRIGYNETSDGHAPGRLAQLVRALASHARGQRFKSSIAHHSRRIRRVLDGIMPKWRNGRRAAFRAQCPLRAWEFKSPLRHHNFLLADLRWCGEVGRNSMPSIDDFVNHRWADAKDALRKLDPDFVSEVESTVRLQSVGLETPWELDVQRGPKRRLASEWHRLLEDCDELVRQTSILQTAKEHLVEDSDAGMSDVEVGKRFFYHMHSWFIHANTLAERTSEVIKRTAELFISDREACKKMTERYSDSVFHQVIKLVREERNEHAHGTSRSWSKNITKDDLWELGVAGGLTPRNAQEEFQYPTMGEIIKSGRYHRFADLTKTIFDRLGGILHELEEDIAVHNAATLQP